jgi:hypothetical protein
MSLVLLTIIIILFGLGIIFIKSIEPYYEVKNVLGSDDERRHILNQYFEIDLPEYVEIKNISTYSTYNATQTIAEVVIPLENYKDFISKLDLEEDLSIKSVLERQKKKIEAVEWLHMDENNIMIIQLKFRFNNVNTYVFLKPIGNDVSIYIFP